MIDLCAGERVVRVRNRERRTVQVLPLGKLRWIDRCGIS
jgi:hypothetical protein